jgi:E3 ubiquitin-protein ligase TRIP12
MLWWTVVAETVVGATTGAVPAPKGYFAAMHSVCQKYGALLILDEVSSIDRFDHAI